MRRAGWERIGKTVQAGSRARSLLTCALILIAVAGPTSAQRLSISARIEPAVLLLASDPAGATLQGYGRNEAKLALPVAAGKTNVPLSAAASAQPSNRGCMLQARASTNAAITINGQPLSTEHDTVVLENLAYNTLVKLAVEAQSSTDGESPSVLLSCRPQ